MSFRLSAVGALVVAGGLAAHANADVLMTFGYTDLGANFASTGGGAGLFTANAVDIPGTLQSDGNVTRLPDGGPGGTAMFDPGFVSLPDLGNFMMAISVFNNNGNTADGAGTFQITDAQGDTISGLIDGTWIRGNLSTFFNGNLSNIVLANTSGDGTFNGSSGGSFSMNFGAVQVFEGSIVNLFTRPAGVGFFQENFTTIADLVSGEIVPAPGTLALLGLSGLVMARRRR